MQKDIGNVMGLYPTPLTVVGTILENGKANFLAIAHVGVVEHGHLLISIDVSHEQSDAAIAANKVVSVSLVNEPMLEAADYCGIVHVADKSKSFVFKWHTDELEKAPIIEEAPVCMTCKIVDMVTVGSFHNYILEPVHTYVEEDCLTDNGKINFEKVSPVLFEFQTGTYLSTGKTIGNCWTYGKDFDPVANRAKGEKCGITCTLHGGTDLEILCYANMADSRNGHDYAKEFRFDTANTARLIECIGCEFPKSNEDMDEIIENNFGHYWYTTTFETFCSEHEIHYEWATHVAYPGEFYDAGKC